MRRMVLPLWLGAQLAFLVILYSILSLGLAGQRTANFSLMRGLEEKGLLATNTANAAATDKASPAHGLIRMNALRLSHRLVIFSCLGWALASSVLLFYSI